MKNILFAIIILSLVLISCTPQEEKNDEELNSDYYVVFNGFKEAISEEDYSVALEYYPSLESVEKIESIMENKEMRDFIINSFNHRIIKINEYSEDVYLIVASTKDDRIYNLDFKKEGEKWIIDVIGIHFPYCGDTICSSNEINTCSLDCNKAQINIGNVLLEKNKIIEIDDDYSIEYKGSKYLEENPREMENRRIGGFTLYQEGIKLKDFEINGVYGYSEIEGIPYIFQYFWSPVTGSVLTISKILKFNEETLYLENYEGIKCEEDSYVYFEYMEDQETKKNNFFKYIVLIKEKGKTSFGYKDVIDCNNQNVEFSMVSEKGLVKKT